MSTAPAPSPVLPRYIVVDLDGTLVRTDTFVATLLEAIRRSPLSVGRLASAWIRGRAECKRVAALIARLDVSVLPYNDSLLTYLREQRACGRTLILATGADKSIADDVARHLQIFDDVMGSAGSVNLVGKEKAGRVRLTLGDAPFTYAGNSRSDLKVWHYSRSSILVSASASCTRKLRSTHAVVEMELPAPPIRARDLLHCARVHQWSKNALVFLPLLLSHRTTDPAALGKCFVAFLTMCFLASALYIANDMTDLQADRLHPRKRSRPLASGVVSIAQGAFLSAALFSVSAGLGLLLPATARWLLAGYGFTVLLYSLWLKRLLFLDVVSLGMFYTLRVLYGGAATSIRISVWTLAFSLFLFSSLAAIKRLTELRRAGVNAVIREYRGYLEPDILPLTSLAAASGYVSVLILALYINSPEVLVLYKRPQHLWLLCPVLIYWVSRLCILANRGVVHDDPVSFALTDRATWVVGVICAFVVILSSR